MGYRPHSDRRGLRRAVAASVALHLMVATAVVVAVRMTPRPPPVASVDARAGDVAVKMFAEVESVAVVVEPTKPQPAPDPPADPPPTPPPSPPQPVPRPEVARTPRATAIPDALPADVLNRIRRATATSLRPPNPAADPGVKPAAAATVPPIHGAMAAGQSVVYVLDCSGSMGEFGKLAAARAALVATLRRQPAEVRFQVVAYGTTAKPLLAGGCVPATAANVAGAESALAGLTAAGRSNHAEAVRRAAELRPDVILILTDAADLPASALKLPRGAKPARVFVARVAADGVGTPREVK